MMKTDQILNNLTIPTACLLVLLLAGKTDCSPATGDNSAPLANMDKVMKVASNVKFDSITDPKLASNVTNALNEMANNLRKMFMENRRLSAQVQDVLQRVQNATNSTGTNATATVANIQKQANQNMPNMTNLNLNNLMPRFQAA